MSTYAKNTDVASDRSRAEIEKTLTRYGASEFGYATKSGMAIIAFCAGGRQVRFVLPLPKVEDYRFTETGRDRTETSKREAWEQACRQRWRALALVIKAKLEAVECGISVFEEEFMANIVLPGGGTVGEFMIPQIEKAYLTGDVPVSLSLLGG